MGKKKDKESTPHRARKPGKAVVPQKTQTCEEDNGNLWDEYFKPSWCPLFGHLPDLTEIGPLDSQAARCIDIIWGARELWHIFPSDELSETSWPEPGEMPHYPEQLLLAARDIFREWMAIDQTVFYLIFPRTRKPRCENISPHVQRDIVPEDLLTATRWTCKLPKNEKGEDIPDYAILAVHAITQAWYALNSLLYWGEPESEVYKTVQEAASLLSRARSMAAEDDLSRADAEIESLKPIADRGRKFPKGRPKNTPDILSKEIEKVLFQALQEGTKPTDKNIVEVVWNGLYKKRDSIEFIGYEAMDPFEEPAKEISWTSKGKLKHCDSDHFARRLKKIMENNNLL